MVDVIWGIIDMLIVSVVEFYYSGVVAAMKKGLLPSYGRSDTKFARPSVIL